jgi:uncharacterized ubiquitin-like protein YukD
VESTHDHNNYKTDKTDLNIISSHLIQSFLHILLGWRSNNKSNYEQMCAKLVTDAVRIGIQHVPVSGTLT